MWENSVLLIFAWNSLGWTFVKIPNIKLLIGCFTVYEYFFTLFVFYKTSFCIYSRNNSDFYPEGLRNLLNEISMKYNGISVYVMDIGLALDSDTTSDKPRVDVIRQYTDGVLKGKNATEVYYGSFNELYFSHWNDHIFTKHKTFEYVSFHLV